MSVGILFSAPPAAWADYEAPLRRALAAEELDDVELGPDVPADRVDYIVFAPSGPVSDFSAFPNLKAVQSLWAGVETVVGNDTLRVPLCRMVDSGLREGMVEWVAGQVLRHHLGLDGVLACQDGRWAPRVPPLARNRPVGILGLGELGTACAAALAGLGFPVMGWSRRRKEIPGISCHAGDDGLTTVLKDAQILVLLLPDTPDTRTILNADTLGRMPQGAVIVNPGRGPLIDDDALLAALDSGRIAHATLDVFRTEPLPGDHPFWSHPGVTVSPHVASATRPDTAAEVAARNIRRAVDGRPLLYQVDRTAGY